MNSIVERINPVFEWITRIAGANLLWFLFNLPVFYFCLPLLLSNQPDQRLMAAVTAAVLAPFFLVPATAALFGVVRTWVLKEERPLFRTFLSAYKENYKHSLAGGFLFSLAAAILSVDYFYMQIRLPAAGYLFLFLLVWLFLTMMYFLADLVHTNTPFLKRIKKATMLTIASPFFSFGIALISLAIIYASAVFTFFLLPFFAGSVIAFIVFHSYYKLFNRLVNLQNTAGNVS